MSSHGQVRFRRRGWGEGGGGTLKGLYIRRFGPCGGHKFKFSYIFGFSEK